VRGSNCFLKEAADEEEDEEDKEEEDSTITRSKQQIGCYPPLIGPFPLPGNGLTEDLQAYLGLGAHSVSDADAVARRADVDAGLVPVHAADDQRARRQLLLSSGQKSILQKKVMEWIQRKKMCFNVDDVNEDLPLPSSRDEDFVYLNKCTKKGR